MSNIENILAVREDEFSFQVISPQSPIFFARVLLNENSEPKIVFSDFRFGPYDSSIALAALKKIEQRFEVSKMAYQITVLDILPTPDGLTENDREKLELCSRHDQLINIFREFCKQNALKIENTFLDFKLGKFNTVVELK